ncbi:A24 family peptidase [Candidatus Endomicrobiellum agilis]|uniref:prepilin peptidase n=1 Tax=Candidatus Endomicrobiellum agilis TaxID=3238957 RepID=UPI0035838F08|nr:A24 family peptidase [Endomicrobium sp.]
MIFFYLGLLLVFYIGFKIGNVIYKTSFVKFLSAFSLAFLFYKFSFSFQFILFAFFTFSLIFVSVVDYFHRIIPVIFPILLIITGVIFSFMNSVLGGTYLPRFANSILGILTGGGVLLIAGLLGQLIYKKEVMGGGDVKLMAGVGAFIGWEKALFAIFFAAITGSIAGLILLAAKKIEKKEYIPFGPFLSSASFITIFFPQPSSFLNTFFIWEMHWLNKIIAM